MGKCKYSVQLDWCTKYKANCKQLSINFPTGYFCAHEGGVSGRMDQTPPEFFMSRANPVQYMKMAWVECSSGSCKLIPECATVQSWSSFSAARASSYKFPSSCPLLFCNFVALGVDPWLSNASHNLQRLCWIPNWSCCKWSFCRRLDLRSRTI
jgi:hypothetical protein